MYYLKFHSIVVVSPLLEKMATAMRARAKRWGSINGQTEIECFNYQSFQQIQDN